MASFGLAAGMHWRHEPWEGWWPLLLIGLMTGALGGFYGGLVTQALNLYGNSHWYERWPAAWGLGLGMATVMLWWGLATFLVIIGLEAGLFFGNTFGPLAWSRRRAAWQIRPRVQKPVQWQPDGSHDDL